MFSHRFLLVLAFVLVINSEITARELASNHESEVEEGKYVHDVREYHMGGLEGINRRLKQYSNVPSYGSHLPPAYGSPLPPAYGSPCCGHQAHITTNDQAADEAQTHN